MISSSWREVVCQDIIPCEKYKDLKKHHHTKNDDTREVKFIRL